MQPDVNEAVDGRAVAVLLHPHPHHGGDRFHRFVDGLFRTLPGLGVTSVRFDLSSADIELARREVVDAIDAALARSPGTPVVLAGYSFGSAVTLGIDDERVAGWYLLAPPATLLPAAAIGPDPRPKAIAVPAFDQFSPPDAVRPAVAGWAATTVTVLAGADHFLGAAVGSAVSTASAWIAGVA